MSDAEKQVSTIAVLGAGTMGHGIAHAAIAAGYTTYLFDVSRTQLDRGAGIEAEEGQDGKPLRPHEAGTGVSCRRASPSAS